MDLLAAHTNAASRALAMPLWALSVIGEASVERVMSWRAAVEGMGINIPPRPAKTQASINRYVSALCAPLLSTDTSWAALNVALFCLRLAQAKGDLVHYVLTYETLMSDEWEHSLLSGGDEVNLSWPNLKRFYDEWFSTLAVSTSSVSDWHELFRDLQMHSLSYDIMPPVYADSKRSVVGNFLVALHEEEPGPELEVVRVRHIR